MTSAMVGPSLATGPGETPVPPVASTSDGAATAPQDAITQVVVVTIDGLNPRALRRLGERRTPVLHALLDDGASTLRARTTYEATLTLPNHTSMVTGRRVDADKGGHGVTWNDERREPATVQAAANEPVESVFTALRTAGLRSAVFASKSKFTLWERSWPLAVNRMLVRLDNQALTRAVGRDIRATDRALTFVHLSEPDNAGHDKGWFSKSYLKAVRGADQNLGRILEAVDGAGETDRTLVIVTADHGGKGPTHTDPTKLAAYRIPFIVRGPGVPAGADLYDLNIENYADPGRRRPAYAADRQPIRNGAVADLVTGVLGLPTVPDSQINADQDLEIFSPAS